MCVLLEEELEAELDLAAGSGGGGDDAGGGTEDCSGGLVGCGSLRGAGGVDDGVGCLQVGVVEDVEELCAELQACGLGDFGDLGE